MKKQLLPLALALCVVFSPTTRAADFSDVPASAYYSQPVAWAVEQSITGGASETTFSPNEPCTTAQILTFLWRAKGSPAPAGTANPFSDVTEADYYYQAALWAGEQGLTSGSTLAPNEPCTRAQAVGYLWRLAGQPGPGSRRVTAAGQEKVTGILGDTMVTAFFDCTIHSAATAAADGELTAGEGMELLIVEMTVRNTYERSLTMYDTDFQLQWGDGARDFGYPAADKSGQLPESYHLAAGEERTGRLIYEIPAGSCRFTLAYRDFFTDGTTGGTYYCRFDMEDGQTVYPALFEDVPAEADFATAVLWACQAGISSGAENGFDPEGVCTRGQIVTFLYRAYGV